MINIAIINLKRMLKDYKAMLIIILLPTLISAFFSSMTIKPTHSITVGVYVDYQSNISDYLLENLYQDKTVKVVEVNQDEIEPMLNDKKLDLGLILTNNKSKPVTILYSSNNAVYNIVKSKINNIISTHYLYSKSKINSVKITYTNTFTKKDYTMIIGFIINFMMFSMIYIVHEIIHLKSNNILRRSFSAPYKSYQLLGGVLLSMFALLLIQVLVLNIVEYLILKEFILKGFLGMVIIIPFIFSILGFGLLLARLVKNADIIPLFANLIIVPTGLISGTFLPKNMAPKFLEKFAFLSPQYWVMTGLNSLENNLSTTISSIAILSLLALSLLALSSHNFTNMLQD